jgi:hypothetical protein
MTGENFKMLNRKNSKIESLKNELENAKEAFTKYSKKGEDENWSWDQLHKLEDEAKMIEYRLDCEIYEDNRRRNWK